MKINKLFALAFAALFTFSACGGGRADVTSGEESFAGTDETSGQESGLQAFCGGIYDGREKIKFVALGDSIARGYGLSDPDNAAYPAIVCEAVRQRLTGTEVEYYNYAVDGDTTTDLLEILNTDADELDGADIVTVSIGANNILLPFFGCLQQLYSLFNGPESPLPGEVSGIGEAAESVLESVNKFLNSEQFASEMTGGIATARADLKEIFKIIKSRAPSAIVLVMLVYSPYHNMVVSLPYIEQKIEFGALSDKWVNELDRAIGEEALAAGCTTVDCYNPFMDKTGLLNVAFSLIPPRFSFDPHPNISGHIFIANLHIAELAGM